jgi:RNA polymerase II C-terminal domain phosphatase-like 1/2
MARLKHDRAMLMQYVAENCVTDARGRRHAAAAESATTAPGEVTFRPVIRLPSPHCRGGQMIFTRIDPANKGTSMLVHVRPGWEEMYGYLAGLDRRADGERKTQHARCAAFVCTMSESQYAQEMWRLLDPRGALIAPKDLAHRVVSVKQGAELKTLEKAVGSWGIAKELCVVLDDRTAVWEPRARPHILAVAPFMPYATDTGPGLRGEAPGEAGVLGAARRMLEKTRMDLFMTYERFAKFHAKFPNAPFEPPAGSLTRRDADNSAVSESVRDTEPFFKTSRPQPPDVSETLPPLMNAHAKEAARAVAQMGGAARSAAGAGSRLNAMLGGIAAPRVAGAVKTLASASFVKNAGGEIRGAGEHEKRDPGIPPESGAGAGDDAREKAAAAAAAGQ